jgi:glycosyltransferase involved in cell wall biosynthesis
MIAGLENAFSPFVGQRKKSLLWIDDIAPIDSLGSGYPRARAIVLMAARLGWHVTIYPLAHSGLSEAELRRFFPPDIELIDEGCRDTLHAYLKKYAYQFDVVIVSRTGNRLAVERIIDQEPNLFAPCRLVYDSEALLAERLLIQQAQHGTVVDKIKAEASIEAEIKQISEKFDAISCVSNREMDHFRASVSLEKQVTVLNLPLQIESNTPTFQERSGLLFVGRLMEQTSPNWLGLMWFLESVWPLLRETNSHMTLTIVGRYVGDSPPVEIEGVRWVGGADNLQPYYDQARLFIAPVFIATGIPLKVINAVAAGVPVVGTERMAELLQWPSSALPVSSTALGFAQAISATHDDFLCWSDVRKASQELIRTQYSVDGFRKSLLKILGHEAT